MDVTQLTSQIEQLMKLNAEFCERQASMEEMIGQLQQEVKKRVADMEQANDLFNFYNTHKGEI